MINSRLLRFVLVNCLVLCCLFACNKKSEQGAAIQHDSLLIKYNTLSDSVEYNWTVMIEDDDQKLFLLNRLLQEVSYTNNYDKVRFEELKGLLEQLKSLRYDQSTMSNSALIDAYDSATFDVSDQIFLFARSHPRFQSTPIMSELMNEISAKNNYILMHRIRYDSWVKDLNEFKENNREEILKGDAQLDVESMPLFQLPF